MRKSKLGSLSIVLIIAIAMAASNIKTGYGWVCTLYAGCSGPGVVKCYDGSSWTTISPTLGYAVLCLVEYQGHLYAGTTSTFNGGAAGTGIGKVWRWDGGMAWTLVGTMDNAVCALAVYGGYLYAGTCWDWGGHGMKLYKYDDCSITWTQVIPSSELVWEGTRALYVSHGLLLMGDIGFDRMAHWDGTTFTQDVSAATGSCIYDYQDYGGYVYAAAYEGRLWQSPDATTWSVALGFLDGSLWELEAFQGKLYMGYDAGYLMAYDGTGSLRGTLVYTAPDGIISMTKCTNYLFFGTGGEAISNYFSDSTGIANVYEYDGTTVTQIGSNMGTGVQDLLVSVLPCPVIPETPLGTIVASATMIMGLVAYVTVPRLRRIRG